MNYYISDDKDKLQIDGVSKYETIAIMQIFYWFKRGCK